MLTCVKVPVSNFCYHVLYSHIICTIFWIFLLDLTKLHVLLLIISLYEGRLISNAHSEISTKRDHVFKQTKVGSKVQYFSYKLTYLFFDIVALSFSTFSPM